MISPEQRELTVYSTSSDIYSAGLILLELLMFEWCFIMINRMFHTDMERLTSFQTIRTSGKLHDTIYHDYPEFVDVLKNMLNEDPQKRSTAHELLNLPIFSNQSKRELLNIIDEKEKKVYLKKMINW